MASTGGEATFRISIDGNAAEATRNVTASTRLAAQAITKYEAEIKDLSADLRRLKGNSDEVNATKKVLKERVDKARAAVSTLTTEISKSGTTFAAASKSSKKWSDGIVAALSGPLGKAKGKLAGKLDGVGKGIAESRIGKALSPAAKAIGAFGTRMGERFAKVSAAVKPIAEKSLPALKEGLSMVATGAGVASAAVLAVGAAAVAGAAALGAFGLAAADSAAKMQRQRQALWGNAQDAKALGEQISSLAGKVPQGVEELQAMSLELSKTRLSGKAVVDTLAAVAQISGAVDAGAGAKVQELVTRMQQTGRMGLNALELQGTGLDFNEVAKAYATGTKKSLDAARKELMSGTAPIEEGAKAVRLAAEKQFGELNVANAFSLENAPKKFAEQFKVLSSGIKLEPLSKGLQAAFGQLSPEAPLGRAVQTFMTGFGNGIVEVATRSIPILVEGFKWLMVGALKVVNFFMEMKKRIQDAFSAEGWKGVGKEVVSGLIEGWTGQQKWLGDSIVSLAKLVKKSFTGELVIRSPSKVFAGYGQNTVEGYAQGVERAQDRAGDAVAGMVPAPGAAASSGGAGSGGMALGGIVINITGGGGEGGGGISSPAFLAALTNAVREAVKVRGLQGAT